MNENTYGYLLHGSVLRNQHSRRLDDRSRLREFVRWDFAGKFGQGVALLHVVLEGILGAHDGTDEKLVDVGKRFVDTAAGAAGRI